MLPCPEKPYFNPLENVVSVGIPEPVFKRRKITFGLNNKMNKGVTLYPQEEKLRSRVQKIVVGGSTTHRVCWQKLNHC